MHTQRLGQPQLPHTFLWFTREDERNGMAPDAFFTLYASLFELLQIDRLYCAHQISNFCNLTT